MSNKYSLKNIKKIKWGVLEENDPISLYPCMYPGWTEIIKNKGKFLGKSQQNMISIQKGTKGILFVDHVEWTKLGEYALKKIVKNPNFALKLNKDILVESDKLTNFTESKIFKVDLSKKTAAQLIKLYQDFVTHHANLYNKAIIPVYLELYKPHLTKFLVDYLHKQISNYNYIRKAKECFALLTISDDVSRVQDEERALLKLAEKINRDNKLVSLFKTGKQLEQNLKRAAPAVYKALTKHIEAYCYLGYNFEGPSFPASYFIHRLRELVLNRHELKSKLLSLHINKQEAKRTREKIERDLQIDAKHRALFQTTREIIFGKDYRKMSLVKSYYQLEPLLKEIAKRTYMTLSEVRNCLPDELLAILLGKIERPKQLDERMKGCLYVVVNGQMPPKIFVDDVYKTMWHYLQKEEDLTEVNYFHGQVAATGKARGRVCIINSAFDAHKMKPGFVLVSQMTNPDLVPAMKQAAAIITDRGGVTCHAAIVSRELGIPCVIGTRIATRALKDGDLVFVDADQGEIRKI